MICGGINQFQVPYETCDLLKGKSRWILNYITDSAISRTFAASGQSPFKDFFVTGGFIAGQATDRYVTRIHLLTNLKIYILAIRF